MCILASEIKQNNKTLLTGLCEVFFISWGEISLANTGRAWSQWISDGCWEHSYSYSLFQPPAGRWAKAISSSRATLVKSANGRKWHLRLGKSPDIINVHSCGSSGSLIVRQVWWIVLAQGEGAQGPPQSTREISDRSFRWISVQNLRSLS